MKTCKWMSVGLGLMVVVGTVSAQTMGKELYGELGYLGMKITENATSVKPKLVRAVIGKEIEPHLAVEAMVGLTFSKDHFGSGTSERQYTSNTFGIYVKPMFEVVKDTQVFGRLGAAHTTLKISNSSASASDSINKLALGLGVQTQFNKDIYGQIDYMRYGKMNNIKFDGITLSLGTRF